MNNLLKIGFCRKVHGLKGGFTFVLENTEDSALKELKNIIIRPINDQSSIKATQLEVKIKSISFGNKVIAYLDGIIDRNEAESLVPFDIYINKSDLPKLESGEYYLSDLIGFSCVNRNGKEVGIIEKYYDNSAQTIVVIRTENGKLIDLPFVDQFFGEIDDEQKKIQVNIPEYI